MSFAPRSLWGLLGALASCLSLSCSSKPIEGASGSTLASSCSRLADVYCGRLVRRSPALLEPAYHDERSCRATQAERCERWFSGIAGVNPDSAGVERKADELVTGSCATLASFFAPSDLPGLKPLGGSCWRAEQCASLYCGLGPLRGGCGTCQPLPAPSSAEEHRGEPCDVFENSYDCHLPGMVCDLATETCVLTPERGEPCVQLGALPSAYDVCARGLECHAGICVESLFFGDSCSPAADRCSAIGGLVCNAASECDLAMPAHVEGPCGGFMVEHPGQCGSADDCRASTSEDAPGQCVPRTATYGTPCTAANCPYALACLDDAGHAVTAEAPSGTCRAPAWSDACN